MVKLRHERALMGEKPHCPDCERVALRRQGRVGFLQRVVYPRLGLFPWECGLCRKIFMLGQRSTGYRQHATEDELVPESTLESALERRPKATLDTPSDKQRESKAAAAAEPQPEFTGVARGGIVRRDLVPAHGLSAKAIKPSVAQGNLACATLPRASRPNKIAG